MATAVFAGDEKSQVPAARAGLQRLDRSQNGRPLGPINAPWDMDGCRGRGFISASFFFPGECFLDERWHRGAPTAGSCAPAPLPCVLCSAQGHRSPCREQSVSQPAAPSLQHLLVASPLGRCRSTPEGPPAKRVALGLLGAGGSRSVDGESRAAARLSRRLCGAAAVEHLDALFSPALTQGTGAEGLTLSPQTMGLLTIPSVLQQALIWLITLTPLWRLPPNQPSRLRSPSPGQGSQVPRSSPRPGEGACVLAVGALDGGKALPEVTGSHPVSREPGIGQ